MVYIYIYFLFLFLCFFSYNQRFFLWHETQFSDKFGAKLSLPYHFFSWKLPTNRCYYVYCMCTVAINVLEPGAFNAISVFHTLIYKISLLSRPQPRGDEASKGGCNSGSTGHDFSDNFNIYFFIFTMRTGPFSKCENRSSFQIGCQVTTWAVLTSSENLQSGSHDSFSLASSHWTESWRRFSAGEWEPPKTGVNPTDQINSQLNEIVQVNSKMM